MRRLRGSDAFTIYSETPTSPFVTLKVAIYQPTSDDDVPDIDEIKEFVKEGIARHGASAAMRIVRVPLDLHHPVWVADPEFCPDNHIFHLRLPPPGDKAQLCDFISELMGRPLDANRPLWEVWIVDGLADGKLAIVAKLHHALADGITIAAMIADSHSKSPAQEVRSGGAPGEAIPGKPRLVRDALVDLFKSYTVDLPVYYRYLKQARERGRALAAGGRNEQPTRAWASHTILNSTGGSGRIYRYETVPLAAVKALSKVFACTINTLVMGICSEALRRYLQEVDVVPPMLISAMPVGALGEEDFQTLLNSDIHNNSLAVATVPLALDIVDFAQRLQAIMRAATTAIEHVRRRGGRRFDNYLDYVPGTVIRAIQAGMTRRQKKRKSLFANLIISNVAGPKQPLYAVDGRLEMVELFSTGNLQDAGSLNITVWSYVDKICFSCYSRKGALPQPEKINCYIREVIEELRALHLGNGTTAASR